MAIREMISVDDVVDFLNDLLTIDRNFTEKLIMTRFKCNDELICHPTVQHLMNPEMTAAYAGFMGVINGLFGVDEEVPLRGSGAIHVCVSGGRVLALVNKEERFEFPNRSGERDEE